MVFGGKFEDGGMSFFFLCERERWAVRFGPCVTKARLVVLVVGR